MLWKAPKHKPDVTLRKALGDMRNALSKKCIVPQVRWLKRARSKENDNPLAESVCGFDRRIQCGIVMSTLGTLHPVDNAGAIGIGRPCTANRDSGIVRKLG